VVTRIEKKEERNRGGQKLLQGTSLLDGIQLVK
jgi:hypothetical protein